ncbi:MAG: hypothetical protein ABWK01_03145 [Infirmifilum sp.]
MKRRASIGLLAVVLLSLLVVRQTDDNYYRVQYRGEDAHIAVLTAARVLCEDPARAPAIFQILPQFISPVTVKSYTLSQFLNFSRYDEGRLECRWVIQTNVGSDEFALNYAYRLVGFRVDAYTGRILRLYNITAMQSFKIPEYPYIIAVSVRLYAQCPHDYINGTILALRENQPCRLTDKWGNGLVIAGG